MQLEQGYTSVGRVLSDDVCRELIAMYTEDARFRSSVVMERHNFGVGDYKYFANPLPRAIADVRERFYAELAPVVNHWMEHLRLKTRYPDTLAEFTARCAK